MPADSNPLLAPRATIRTVTYEEHPLKLYAVLFFCCCAYFGKYFCTSDMYVIQKDFMIDQKVTSLELSTMFAVGFLFSMFGKIAAGLLSDTQGGFFVILLAVGGYSTVNFLLSICPAGNFPMFMTIWAANGFFALGLAWVAVVAVATNWVPVSHLGRLMVIVNMAPQIGDALARLVLSNFVYMGWRRVFQIAGCCGIGLAIPCMIFVRNAPVDSRETIQEEKKLQDEANKGKSNKPFMERVKPMLKNPLLWALCLLSGSLYGTRTLFLIYSSTFLAEVYCFGSNDSGCTSASDTLDSTGMASSVYTMLGCVSVVIVGFMKDWLPKKHRGSPLVLFILPLFFEMLYLASTGTDLPYGVAVVVVALTGFCLFGPYKILGSVFSVDVGGKELKATACSLMGVFDNFFAMSMMLGKGLIGNDWHLMFSCLSGLSLLSLICASYIWYRDISNAKPDSLAQELHVLEKEICADVRASLVRRETFHEHTAHH